MLTLRQIEMVRALAEHRHFARAAEALNITQSALTKGLQATEAAFGVRLFDRGVGAPEPTLFGRIILDNGQTVLRDIAHLLREIDLAKGLDVGEITVSAGVFPSELWAPQALGRLADAHPKLKCALRTGDGRRAVQDVLDGISDIAIVDAAEAKGRSELASLHLATTRIVLFCRPGHPASRRRRLKPSDLFGYPFVGPRLPKAFARGSLGKLGEVALSLAPDGHVTPRVSVESFSAMLQAVLHSDAIGWAPDLLLAPYARRGELKRLETGAPPIETVFALITRTNRTPSPAVAEFVRIVQSIRS